MKAVIKFPFKLQDLIILEANKLFNSNNIIEVTPLDFGNVNMDYSNCDIILGLGKDISKSEDFKVPAHRSFNNRDTDYLDHLRFNNKLEGRKCVKLKTAISSFRKGVLNNDDKANRVGTHSITDVNSLLESYTGYGTIKQEYLEKSKIINKWLKELSNDNQVAELIKDAQLKEAVIESLNKIFNLELDSLETFLSGSSEDTNLSTTMLNNLKVDIKAFLTSKFQNVSSSNIYNLMNTKNYKNWIHEWVLSRKIKSEKDIQYIDLWNSCDFSKDKVVINTTGVLIPSWKSLAKEEGDILFFVTPEVGTDNWSIISLNPTNYPLVDELGLSYWSHVTKFLAKFENFDAVENYLAYITGVYKDKTVEESSN